MTKKFLPLLLLLSLTYCGLTQNATIKGTVTDINSKELLIGVSVRVDGTSTGAVTDFDGNYSISMAAGSYTLIFSYLGYEEMSSNITLKEGETRTLNMALGDLPMLIDALVVTASKYEK
jgi:hypothetical protein